MNLPEQYSEIKIAFAQAADLAGISIPLSEIEVKFDVAPHVPPSSLPTGRMAVYVFMFGERCLKVGKAGPKSAARFCSQHYEASRAPSTLARSLLKGQADIRDNTSRVNFLIPSIHGMFALSLLEAFVQCRLKPKFEGFAGQLA